MYYFLTGGAFFSYIVSWGQFTRQALIFQPCSLFPLFFILGFFGGMQFEHIVLHLFQAGAAQREPEQDQGTQQHGDAGDQPDENLDPEYGAGGLV